MSITAIFIRSEIKNQTYVISLHADEERLADGLTIRQIEYALSDCEILETYPEDVRGESCLVLGFTTAGKAIHIVCGMNRDEHIVWITVYLPTMPKWKDPRTRNRQEGDLHE